MFHSTHAYVWCCNIKVAHQYRSLVDHWLVEVTCIYVGFVSDRLPTWIECTGWLFGFDCCDVLLLFLGWLGLLFSRWLLQTYMCKMIIPTAFWTSELGSLPIFVVLLYPHTNDMCLACAWPQFHIISRCFFRNDFDLPRPVQLTASSIPLLGGINDEFVGLLSRFYWFNLSNNNVSSQPRPSVVPSEVSLVSSSASVHILCCHKDQKQICHDT